MLAKAATEVLERWKGGQYREAVADPDLWMGFPIGDVRLLSGEPLAANRGDQKEKV
jgi:hypothetical protein